MMPAEELNQELLARSETENSTEYEPEELGELATGDDWTVQPEELDFNLRGNQLRVGCVVEQQITITNTKYHSFSYKVYTPHSSKFKEWAIPQKGEVKAGHSETVTIYATLHCTTTVEEPVVVAVKFSHHGKRQYREVRQEVVGKLSSRIDYDELRICEHIGEGCFGSVSRGEFRGLVVAIKELRVVTGEAREEFVREVENLEHIRSPFIVACIGAVITDTRLCLVTEYVPRGSLDVAMRKYTFSPLMKIRIARDICEGMRFIHASNILHRDLKPANVLCVEFQLDCAVVCKFVVENITNIITNIIINVHVRKPTGLRTLGHQRR